ncbi:GPCR fungal pheromone mating factor, partial [Flagelloscypha sp. PMI_526]
MSDDYVNPTYPAFPIFAFIGAFLVLTPLPWHLQAWNAGTCLYMFWVAAGCFYTAVNSIIWHDNAIDLAPHWCDFTTRLGMAIFIGIPASSLCINRRLYKIASSNTIGSSTKERRTAILIDLAIGLGLPILEIPLSYIVQGHRYDIYEGYGCLIALVNTPLSYVLVYTWPIILGIISAVYCVLTLRAFLRRRAEFAQFLSTSGPVASGMSINRYFRLMALATTELLFNLPFSTYGLYFNITAGKIRPYVSWDDLHFEFWAIGQIPSVLFRTDRTIVTSLELQRWLLVLCAILFFALFGFSQEAKKFYRDIFWKVAGVFGKHPQAPVSKMDSLPSYVKSEKMESSTPKP